ncbi:TonB-dependent receptor [Reichenbachiella sp. MALMAid0571]|uniref:SusC/RagA family TonB-linked outer membrane protein n=1 Tax=Reichenbachiella sp. MALMAid0571 TaxID=3143939 RepID=UPI0032DE57AF
MYSFYGLSLQFLLYGLLLAAGESNAQKATSVKEVNVSIDFSDDNLITVFEKIEKLSDYNFVFDKKDLDKRVRVNGNYKEDALYNVLMDISKKSGLTFKQVNKNINVQKQNNHFSLAKEEELIQVLTDIEVSGKITDENGDGLPGASIVIKGTAQGTTSDIDGNFKVTTSDESILTISFVGYITQEVIVGGRSTIDTQLVLDAEQLEEIVVVGYGVVKKSDLTGSVGQVKSKEINSYPASSMMQAMAGRVAGVQVIQSTGAPGAGVSVRIRGTNSIQGGNEPLYVVDGFPYSGNPTNINNSDIESIEILKDASATAIYGSRGANGVVLVTTKRGKAGITKVDIESSYSVQTLRSKLDLMNGEEYATVANLQAENDNVAPYFTQQEIDAFGEGFDWQDLVFQKAPIKSSSININGGSESTQYSIGGSVFGQEGIIKGSDYNRYSLSTNFNHKISKKISLQLSNSLSYLNTKRKDSGGGSRGNSLIGAAIAAAPISKPYNEDGSYTVLGNAYPFVPVDVLNPLNFINEQQREVKANVVLTNASLFYKITPDLTLKVSGGIENRDDRTDAYTTRNFHNSSGSASVSTSQFRSLLSENTLSYSKTLNEKHQISVVAGFTYQDFVSTSLAASGTGFLSDVFQSHSLESSETPGIPSTGYSKSVLSSYLGRVNYAFNNKYLMTLSFRTDGSSRYSKDNKWGYFPSAALAWRLGDEEFMKGINLISDLKIRTSWGRTGSQAISPYTTLNLLSSGLTVLNDQLYNTFAPGTRLPGDLRWETTEQFDFGFDLSLLENRIFITADYYIKNTSDLLNTVLLPSSLGYTSTIQNIGSVQNKGVELGVTAKILTGDFNWELYSNISINRNKVTKLHNGEDIFTSSVSVLAINDRVQILKEGYPIGQFWGFKEDGYDDEGYIKIVDTNEDEIINSDDKTFIGDANPDFIYGFNSNMSYKNFELSLFIQGSQGNDIFNASLIPLTNDFGQGLNAPRGVFLDHWTPQNTNARYPLISRNTDAYASDRWIEDGSYLRLRNIELAYTLPIESNWLRKAQFYLSGQNLLTLTKYSWWDPEVNSRGASQPGIDHFTYPIPKTLTIGVRVGL